MTDQALAQLKTHLAAAAEHAQRFPGFTKPVCSNEMAAWLVAELERLQALNESLAARVAAQSELLSRKAEAPLSEMPLPPTRPDVAQPMSEEAYRAKIAEGRQEASAPLTPEQHDVIFPEE